MKQNTLNQKANSTKKKANIEAEIIDLLSKEEYFRRSRLINHFKAKGYSKSKIERALVTLKESKKISKGKGLEDFKKYGIDETAENASYFLLKKTTVLKKHIEEVTSLLKSNDSQDRKDAISELSLYKSKYNINKVELKAIIDAFTDESNKTEELDKNSIGVLVNIVSNCILADGIEPDRETRLVEWLKRLLEDYHQKYKSESLRRNILHLLGNYKESVVIDQL
ncbi:hypothetical protein [Methanohalophilus mahii]|nr:hypothetical protein [Methanohalophilus mahii]